MNLLTEVMSSEANGSTSEKSESVYRCGSEHPNCEGCHEQKINNSDKLLEKMAKLYANQLMNDITLVVNGVEFPAHRLILCASSDVFQVMLMNRNWSESKKEIVILQEEEDCSKVFPKFLKYLYTGIIKINHNLVLPLGLLADKYNVRDLVTLCVEYMRKHIVSATKHNQLVSWLQYVLTSDHESIINACTDFVAWNFEAVSRRDDFFSLETEVLIQFLKKSDLVVKDEFTLLTIITKWLEPQERRLGDVFFPSLVPLVVSYIRFPMIEPLNLAKLLTNPLIQRFKDFFFDQMSLAMIYHSEGLTPELKSKLPALSFTPRLYTTEKWSSSLFIENYDNLPIYGVRTLVFNTPSALSDRESMLRKTPNNCVFSDSGPSYEWVVEIYPKGIWFKKYHWIHWRGSLEMPEWVSKTVRLSVRQADKCLKRRVSIGVLLSGKLDGIEYIKRVVRTHYIFTEDDKLLNIDDIIPFDDLNESAVNSASNSWPNNGSPDGNASSAGNNSGKSGYLIGSDNNTLKIQVIITPLSDE